MNSESIARIRLYAESSLSRCVEVNGRHSSPHNSIDYTADRQRPILIASFALELRIKRSLVAAAYALDKRDRKTVSALEVGTPRYLNLSQLSMRSPFAKRTCLTQACPMCIALVLSWLIVRRFRRQISQAGDANIRRRQLIRPEDRYHQRMRERRYG